MTEAVDRVLDMLSRFFFAAVALSLAVIIIDTWDRVKRIQAKLFPEDEEE